MIVLAGLAPERERYHLRYSVFKQAERMTDLCFDKYGSVADIISSSGSTFRRGKLALRQTLTDPQRLTTFFSVALLAIFMASALALKLYRASNSFS